MKVKSECRMQVDVCSIAAGTMVAQADMCILMCCTCSALEQLLQQLPQEVRSRCGGIAFDGTSATAMLVDRATGESLAPPQLYNVNMSAKAVEAAKVHGIRLHSSITHARCRSNPALGVNKSTKAMKS